jgi:para-aminobenzoate synthetase component I
MSSAFIFSLPQPVSRFRQSLIRWAASQDNYCLLNSNGYTSQNIYTGGESLEFLLATGSREAVFTNHNAWEGLKVFFEKNKGKWMFGQLSYDLKNQTEQLRSGHKDRIAFPLLHFFVPLLMIQIKGKEVIIHAGSFSEAEKIYYSLLKEKLPLSKDKALVFKHTESKEEYLQKVRKILNHIHRGDVYEMNYCIEFFAERAEISPEETYLALNEHSAAPFSALYKLNNRYLISASPERFLAKRAGKLFSQPVKGTIKRGSSREQDRQLMEALQNDPKERSENIMIVDLVRNDLSRSCEAGSVLVDELCGIYTFPHVHQMISTVSGKLKNDIHPVDAIKNAFPMGSMTGAPKVRAMQLIEDYEQTKRGLYSGSVGYINPSGDFDFNVVIRSIQYNMEEKYVSVMAGSAITSLSEPEKEYEECLLKAEALLKVLE